jgi:hypothetical protein
MGLRGIAVDLFITPPILWKYKIVAAICSLGCVSALRRDYKT